MKELEKARNLKEDLVKNIENCDVETSKNKHDLNIFIQELEDELHRLESEKLYDYNPDR